MNRNIKWMMAALAISVAANIFLIGLSLGKGVVGDKRVRQPSHSAGLNARALGQYLDAEERMAMRAIIDADRRDIRRRLGRLHDNEEDIRNAMRAPVVDEEKLNALIDQHEKLVTGSRADIQRKLFNYMATLSHDTRTKIADDLFRLRGPRTRGGNRMGPPPDADGGFDPPPPPRAERERLPEEG